MYRWCFLPFVRTTASMKRQHCRQLWHCHWLKTDTTATTILSLLAPTPPLLFFLHGSEGSIQPQQTHPPRGIHTVSHSLFTPRMFFYVWRLCSLHHFNLMLSRQKHRVGLECIQWLYEDQLKTQTHNHTLNLQVSTQSPSTELQFTWQLPSGPAHMKNPDTPVSSSGPGPLVTDCWHSLWVT